jgi:hypothetical protein
MDVEAFLVGTVVTHHLRRRFNLSGSAARRGIIPFEVMEIYCLSEIRHLRG